MSLVIQYLWKYSISANTVPLENTKLLQSATPYPKDFARPEAAVSTLPALDEHGTSKRRS
jgi:hypothetical protein